MLLPRGGSSPGSQETGPIQSSNWQHIQRHCELAQTYPACMLCTAIRFHGLVPVLVLLVRMTLLHPSLHLNSDRTTYVGQVMAGEIGREPNADFATRKGELAMLFYSIGPFFYPS